jgi:hypothetical protein
MVYNLHGQLVIAKERINGFEEALASERKGKQQRRAPTDEVRYASGPGTLFASPNTIRQIKDIEKVRQEAGAQTVLNKHLAEAERAYNKAQKDQEVAKRQIDQELAKEQKAVRDAVKEALQSAPADAQNGKSEHAEPPEPPEPPAEPSPSLRHSQQAVERLELVGDMTMSRTADSTPLRRPARKTRLPARFKS